MAKKKLSIKLLKSYCAMICGMFIMMNIFIFILDKQIGHSIYIFNTGVYWVSITFLMIYWTELRNKVVYKDEEKESE